MVKVSVQNQVSEQRDVFRVRENVKPVLARDNSETEKTIALLAQGGHGRHTAIPPTSNAKWTGSRCMETATTVDSRRWRPGNLPLQATESWIS